eukprot:11164622-Lingulodinium_polyedra.AAC.1
MPGISPYRWGPPPSPAPPKTRRTAAAPRPTCHRPAGRLHTKDHGTSPTTANTNGHADDNESNP